MLSDQLVLCYHAISDSWDCSLAVHPTRFRKQLEMLARRGYQGVAFTELVEGDSRGKRVAVTFDDGFRSVLEHALPALEEVGWPATMFVVTNFGEGTGPLRWPGIDHWLGTRHAGELRALQWTELRKLTDAGWEVGSHTASHPRLTQLTDAQARRELAESRQACEQHLGAPCSSVAYPYGDCNGAVADIAAAAGYRAGAALPPRLHPPVPMRWPRVGVYHRDWLSRFALKASPVVRRLRTRQAGD